MIDPKTALLSEILAEVVQEVSSAGDTENAWSRASDAVEATQENDEQLRAAVDARDHEALSSMVAGWSAGERLLPEQDRAVLKRAMKAYRKRLKLTQLEADSAVGRGPLSGGSRENILGIVPPQQYPPAVWELLARQGKLVRAGQGMYELPPS